MKYCIDERIEICNRVLQCFAQETTLRLESTGHVIVCWTSSCGEQIERRWMTRGQDFYPVWYKKWGHGGTASTALAQLVRWVRGMAVLPLATWRYWAGERCALLRHGDANEAIAALGAAGYPETAVCVLCRQTISGGMDWWSLDGVSGPCCSWTEGCRQKGGGDAE